MKFAAFQLDNAVRGTEKRLSMVEGLLEQTRDVKFVVLPELSTPGYIPTYDLWNYREEGGERTKVWAVSMAQKHGIYIGCGYVDYSGGEYYNAYLIAGPNGICGTVYKEEPESNLFKRGKYPHMIETPLGKIAVAICFDSHRECFYEGIKEAEPVLILMPHAWAMSVNEDGTVKAENVAKTDFLGSSYADAFDVPVVFCNALGPVERMAGITGALTRDYRLMGQSGVYAPGGGVTHFGEERICRFDLNITKPGMRAKEIPFYETYIDKGSRLFRDVVLPLDIRRGVRAYEKNKRL